MGTPITQRRDARNAIEQKISRLYFHAAQLRLWKEKQAADLSSDLAKARAEIARLRTALDFILASRSWRITAPMRRFSVFVKYLLRRKKEADRAAARLRSESARLASPSGVTHREPPMQDPLAYVQQGKAAWDQFGRTRLAQFLGGHERICFPLTVTPKISIILILHNQAHLSLLSLLSLKHNADVSYEVVIVNNCSEDETSALLARVDNATILMNTENVGFSPACTQAARKSKGEYLCFLNNDALLQAHSLKPALADFENDNSVGAVGGRILLPDGLLQEAGAILWCDGTTNGYGRDDSPEKLKYRFRRPVDYCSGAFLFTRTQLFEKYGGFDEAFAPGYYEDVDYCVRLWDNGFRVLYEPLATLHHYENASSDNKGAALTHVIAHHQTFWDRWQDTLASHYEPCGENIPRARIAASEQRIRILFIASQVPHQPHGGAYSRSWKLLNQLAAEGLVTCAAVAISPHEGDYTDIPRDVELLDATTSTELILRQNVNAYDVIWVLGEANLELLAAALGGTDQLTSTIIADLIADDAEVPVTVLEQGKPSKQFKSISQRDLSLPCNDKDETGGEGRGIVTSGQTIRIWTLN